MSRCRRGDLLERGNMCINTGACVSVRARACDQQAIVSLLFIAHEEQRGHQSFTGEQDVA